MQVLFIVKWEKTFSEFFPPTGYDDGSSVVDICASAESGQHKWSWHEAGKMNAHLWIFEPYSDAWSIQCGWMAWVFAALS